MHARVMLLLLMLLVGSGCMQPFRSDAKSVASRPTSKVPPVPVSPEDVTASNAHEKALAMHNEMDWDDRNAPKK